MTDYDTDQARELRRARLTVVRPHNAPNSIGKAQFDATYKEQHVVVRETMTEVEEEEHTMFCPACQEQMDDTLVAARKLYITYEEDPLRNYRALVTASCKGCGWNEIIPIEGPAPLTEDERQVFREAKAFRAKDQMAQMAGTYSIGAGGAGGMNSLAGMSQNAQAQLNRQMGKSAMLAAAYGAGPNAIKALRSGAVGNIAGMSIHETSAVAPPPRRGQQLADSIWHDYDVMAKEKSMVASERNYVETAKIRDQLMKDAANAMAKSIDKEITDQLVREYKPKDVVTVRKPPKYAVSPPPPPTLDKHDREAMREMLIEECKRADGDPSRMKAAYDRVREFFR